MVECRHIMCPPPSSGATAWNWMLQSRSCYLMNWFMASGVLRRKHLKRVLLEIVGQMGCGSSGIATSMIRGCWPPPSLADIRKKPEACIPVRIWGDDAPLGRSRSMMCVQFCSVMCSQVQTWMSRFLMMAITLDSVVQGATLEPLYDAIAWSFEVLASGFMPHRDHLGQLVNRCRWCTPSYGWQSVLRRISAAFCPFPRGMEVAQGGFATQEPLQRQPMLLDVFC